MPRIINSMHERPARVINNNTDKGLLLIQSLDETSVSAVNVGELSEQVKKVNRINIRFCNGCIMD